LRRSVGSLLLSLLLASTCSAGSLGGSVTASADYVYRGVSLTRNEAALQLDVHFQSDDDWVLGAWASPVQPREDQHATELDLYTQWHQYLAGGVSASFGATYYNVVNDPRIVPYNYLELNAGINWRERLMLSAAWAPVITLASRATGPVTDQQAYSLELTGNQPLPGKLMLQAGLGYFAAIDLPHSGYAYGSSSLGRQFGRLHTALSYFWVQDVLHRPYMAGPAGSPWVVTATWTF
jgi:uncharacterized protein (TIGR02001 family)